MEHTIEDPTGKDLLESYLNKRMRVVISDGRVIDGNFLCTDRDRNIVLGNCEEFFSMKEVADLETNPDAKTVVPRTLGLVIVTGEHIKSIAIAKDFNSTTTSPPLTCQPESR